MIVVLQWVSVALLILLFLGFWKCLCMDLCRVHICCKNCFRCVFFLAMFFFGIVLLANTYQWIKTGEFPSFGDPLPHDLLHNDL